LYLSTENCTLDQRDLVQCLQEKIDKLSTALDLANTSLLSSKTTLKSVQEKCSSLQRDHQRKDLELTKAAERITQLTEVNRNSKLAYNHLLEQNNQYSRKLSGIQQGSSSSPIKINGGNNSKKKTKIVI
jgi:DNA repair ATPase RecN